MATPWRLLYDLAAWKKLNRLPDPLRDRTEVRISSILLDPYDPGVTMVATPQGMLGSLWTIDRVYVVYLAITRHTRWNEPVILIVTIMTEDEFIEKLFQRRRL